MRKDLLPKQLRNITLIGFEPDDDKDDDKSKESEEEEDEEDEDEEKEPKEKADNDGLKSALRKERLAAKKANKDLKAALKRLEEVDSKDKSDTDKAKDDASKAESKAQKLAAKLRDSAVDNAILKLGGGMKFRDLDDALKLVDRSDIEIEQDDDDPSDIELDEASVKSALETLAKAKPHLIIAEGQEDKSGSKFNGGRKSQKELDDETLKKKYSALSG